MAQKTKTWDSLIALVEARLGHGLSDTELKRVQALANDAADALYLETPWWERFLVLEPRTVSRGYVDYTEDSYNVYGAGTSEANGLYVRNGEESGSPAYTLFDSDGTTALYSIRRINTSEWAISEGSPLSISAILYEISDSSTTPPSSGWVSDEGKDPSPIVQALSEIGEYIGHWNGAVFTCAGATAGTAYPDQNGIRITNCNADDVVYVAYKKTLDDIYGDGEAGTESDIPAEWFNFMALQTASAWDGSQDRPTVRVKDIDRAWDQALLKINRQGIYNNIASRFRTYYGCDVSVR
jgi:hypothetical protein